MHNPFAEIVDESTDSELIEQAKNEANPQLRN